MKIWFRTLNALAKPMDLGSTAVEAIFYHLYESMKELELPVVLEDPTEKCIEMWWGWDFQPKGGNINVVLATGITQLTSWERWQEVDIFFLSSEFFMNRNADCTKPMHIWHHHGVDPEIFHVLDRTDEPFIFTHAVFPREHKGSDLLCEAFKKSFSGIDNVFLYIQHPYTEDECFKDFKRKHWDKKIIFISQPYRSRKEAWRLYSGSCYVYPTMLDSVGVTVLEALCTGMPALISDIALFREYYEDGCVWWLDMQDKQPHHGFGRPSIEDIGCKMLYIYNHRAEVKKKGRYAANYMRALYTWRGCMIREFLPVMREYGYL